MAPEYGATCGFFPIDDDTISYLTDTNARSSASTWSRPTPRPRACIASRPRPTRSSPMCSSSELGSIEPSLAGPKRPQDRVALKEVKSSFITAMDKEFNKGSGDGSKEIFDLHPSLATSLDRDFNKPGGSSA
jgi:aconitate hydratase